MSKFRSILSAFFSLFFVCAGLLGLQPFHVKAQESLFAGQKHSYSVFLRGNGEAIVTARISIQNLDSQVMKEFAFSTPGVTPLELTGYQQKMSKACGQYDYQSSKQVCVKYNEPDYFSEYYINYYNNAGSEYTKLKFDKYNSTYVVQLPAPLEPNKSTAVIIAYSTREYVKNTLGVNKFSFETLKVNQRVGSTSVTVDVDEDMMLKGYASKVTYRENSSAAKLSEPLSDIGTSASNTSLDNVVLNIGRFGIMTKTTKNLAAGETFTVRGEYAQSWWLLYSGWIIIALLTAALLVYGVIILRKRVINKSVNAPETTPQTAVTVNSWTTILVDPSIIIAGIASGVGIHVITIVLWYTITYMSSSFYYSSSSSALTVLMIFVTAFFFYLLVLFGPAGYIASKKGIKGFGITMLYTLITFILILVVYLLVYSTGIIPDPSAVQGVTDPITPIY